MAPKPSIRGDSEEAQTLRCDRCGLWRNQVEFSQDGTTSPHEECLECRDRKPTHQPAGAQQPASVQQQRSAPRRVSPMSPSRFRRCPECKKTKHHLHFDSPQNGDLCAQCAAASLDGWPASGRGSGGVEDEEENQEAGHTCPGCGFHRSENEFTTSSPRCSDCRKRELETNDGGNRRAAPRRREPLQEHRGFISKRIRLALQEQENQRGQEQESERSEEQESGRSEEQENERSEEQENEPPRPWSPHKVETPYHSRQPGLPNPTTLCVWSSDQWFEETLARIHSNHALAEEFRIMLNDDISLPVWRRTEVDVDDDYMTVISPGSHTNDWENCDETGLEQSAFGWDYFDRDLCRLRQGNAGGPYDELHREKHLRWIGCCDWRGVPQLRNRELPHHRIQPGMPNAGEDGVNVGEANDYVICDACRTAAHSRLPWEEFPDIPDGEELAYPQYVTRRREDIEVAPPTWPRSRISGWRQWIQHSWLPVCEDCDTRQKRRHPRGHDGCECYQRRYLDHWLCQRCDAENLREYIEVTRQLKLDENMHTHAVCGGALTPHVRPDEGGRRCPCGALPTLRDTETTMERGQMVKRCGHCLGFIVPKASDPAELERRRAAKAQRKVANDERRAAKAERKAAKAKRKAANDAREAANDAREAANDEREAANDERQPRVLERERTPTRVAKAKRQPRVLQRERTPTRVSKRGRATQSPGSRLQMLNERGKTADQPIFV